MPRNLFSKLARLFFKKRHYSTGQRCPYFRMCDTKIDTKLLDRSIAISHRWQFVYFRVSKAANSTVIASLYKAENAMQVTDLNDLQFVKDGHFSCPSSLDENEASNVHKDYRQFSFVRDPYARTLAAYLDKIARGPTPKRSHVNSALGLPDWHDTTFDEFLCYLEKGGTFDNAHWAVQSALVPVRNLDFCGKVETISSDLPKLLKQIFGKTVASVDVTAHRTGATRNHPVLDARARKRIYSLYRTDFDRFEYVK